MCNFERIQQLRKEKGITLKYLCEIVGERRAYISDCALKGINPPQGHIEKWASALNTSPAYLMGETDDPEPQAAPRIQMDDTEKEEWSRLWDAATPEARETALRVLRLAEQKGE